MLAAGALVAASIAILSATVVPAWYGAYQAQNAFADARYAEILDNAHAPDELLAAAEERLGLYDAAFARLDDVGGGSDAELWALVLFRSGRPVDACRVAPQQSPARVRALVDLAEYGRAREALLEGPSAERGQLELALARYGVARHALEAAQPLAQHPDDRAWILLLRASVECALGEFARARVFQEQGMSLLLQHFASAHPLVGIAWSIRADIDHAQEGPTSAADGYLVAHDTLEAALGRKDHPLMLRALMDLASVDFDLEEWEDCLAKTRKAIALMDRHEFYNGHPERAAAMVEIASVVARRPDLAGGDEHPEQLFAAAIAMLETTFGGPLEHPALANAHNNMATFLEASHRLDEALVHHETALLVKERFLPPDHPLIALAYHNIAAVHERRGDYARALEWLERARASALRDDRRAVTLHNMGVVHHKMGNHDAAMDLLHQALDLTIDLFGTKSAKSGRLLTSIASIELARGHAAEARNLLVRALDSQDAELDRALSLHNLGTAYMRTGNLTGAVDSLTEAIRIKEHALWGSPRASVLASLNELAVANEHLGNRDAARRLHRDALLGKVRELGWDHPDTALAVSNVAVVWGKDVAEVVQRAKREGRTDDGWWQEPGV